MVLRTFMVNVLLIECIALVAGCFAVPGEKLSERVKVVGAREDGKGQIVEQFIFRTEEFRVTWIGLTCEGLVVPARRVVDKFFHVAIGSCEEVHKKLGLALCEFEEMPDFVPIPHSDRWIIVKHGKIMSADEYHDLTILIYSHKDGLIRECKINDRICRNGNEWSIDEEYRRMKILTVRDSKVIPVYFDWVSGDVVEELVDGLSSNTFVGRRAFERRQLELCNQPLLKEYMDEN